MHRFTARIGRGVSIAEDVEYDDLVARVLEYVARAAIAKDNDQYTWEEEEVRRQGLNAIDFVKDGKALWSDRDAFATERSEAKREGVEERFLATNQCGRTLLEALDADLRERLRLAGYFVVSLRSDMRDLYREIAADASDRSAQAKEDLVADILGAAGPRS